MLILILILIGHMTTGHSVETEEFLTKEPMPSRHICPRLRSSGLFRSATTTTTTTTITTTLTTTIVIIINNDNNNLNAGEDDGLVPEHVPELGGLSGSAMLCYALLCYVITMMYYAIL